MKTLKKFIAGIIITSMAFGHSVNAQFLVADTGSYVNQIQSLFSSLKQEANQLKDYIVQAQSLMNTYQMLKTQNPIAVGLQMAGMQDELETFQTMLDANKAVTRGLQTGENVYRNISNYANERGGAKTNKEMYELLTRDTQAGSATAKSLMDQSKKASQSLEKAIKQRDEIIKQSNAVQGVVEVGQVNNQMLGNVAKTLALMASSQNTKDQIEAMKANEKAVGDEKLMEKAREQSEKIEKGDAEAIERMKGIKKS